MSSCAPRVTRSSVPSSAMNVAFSLSMTVSMPYRSPEVRHPRGTEAASCHTSPNASTVPPLRHCSVSKISNADVALPGGAVTGTTVLDGELPGPSVPPRSTRDCCGKDPRDCGGKNRGGSDPTASPEITPIHDECLSRAMPVRAGIVMSVPDGESGRTRPLVGHVPPGELTGRRRDTLPNSPPHAQLRLNWRS
jgi:hypothetical protein